MVTYELISQIKLRSFLRNLLLIRFSGSPTYSFSQFPIVVRSKERHEKRAEEEKKEYYDFDWNALVESRIQPVEEIKSGFT